MRAHRPQLGLAAAPADLRSMASFSSTSQPNFALIQPIGNLRGIVPPFAAHPIRRDASCAIPPSQRYGMQIFINLQSSAAVTESGLSSLDRSQQRCR
jgi:hypothetical protein